VERGCRPSLYLILLIREKGKKKRGEKGKGNKYAEREGFRSVPHWGERKGKEKKKKRREKGKRRRASSGRPPSILKKKKGQPVRSSGCFVRVGGKK